MARGTSVIATGSGLGLVWGEAGDQPAAGDYDGDGRTDVAVFRPSTGVWYIRYAATGTGPALLWGSNGDVSVPGDYDGDHLTDIAVFRAASNTWYVRYTATGAGISLIWGDEIDTPVPGDYDGDGLTDIAVFRASTAPGMSASRPPGALGVVAWGGVGGRPDSAAPVRRHPRIRQQVARGCLLALLIVSAARSGIGADRAGHLVLVGGGPTPADVFTRTLDLSGGRSAVVAVLPQTYPNDTIGDAAVAMWQSFGVRDVVKVSRTDPEAARAAIERATLIWIPGGFQGLFMKTIAASGIRM